MLHNPTQIGTTPAPRFAPGDYALIGSSRYLILSATPRPLTSADVLYGTTNATVYEARHAGWLRPDGSIMAGGGLGERVRVEDRALSPVPGALFARMATAAANLKTANDRFGEVIREHQAELEARRVGVQS